MIKRKRIKFREVLAMGLENIGNLAIVGYFGLDYARIVRIEDDLTSNDIIVSYEKDENEPSCYECRHYDHPVDELGFCDAWGKKVDYDHDCPCFKKRKNADGILE